MLTFICNIQNKLLLLLKLNKNEIEKARYLDACIQYDSKNLTKSIQTANQNNNLQNQSKNMQIIN